MNSKHTSAPVAAHDEPLRAALRDALARSTGDGLQPLQSKVLQQWRRHHDESGGVLAALRLRWRRHPALAGGALLALGVAGVLWVQSFNGPDPGAEELQQLDVLSLMTMGEL